MRRFHLGLHGGRLVRSCSSYVAGLFHFKVNPKEMFPFPEKRFDSEEHENLQSLIEQLRSNDTEFNPYGARIPAEYGGLGLSFTAHALLLEELGQIGNEEVLNSVQHCGLCTHLISTVGTKEVKGKYLTGMSDGSMVMGWAVEEGACGSDISMICASAEQTDNKYMISGRKIVFNAENATHFVVLAKAATQKLGEDGKAIVGKSCSFFVCPRAAPGVTVAGNVVSFTNTPAEDILGAVGDGFKDHMITHFTEHYLYSAALIGALKRVVGELKRAVPSKWVRSTVAACACSIYAMESALYALAANFDVPAPDSLLEAAIVNAFVSTEATNWIYQIATAMPPSEQLEGSLSGAIKIASLLESKDFLYATAVCCGVEDYGLFFQRTSALQMIQIRTMRSLGMKDRIPVSNTFQECSRIEDAIINFGGAVESTFVRNGSQVPYQQLIINRLGEAAGLIYAASACASRASLCASKGIATSKTERQLAAAFIRFAMERANKLSNECCHMGSTADDTYKRIALELCEDALGARAAAHSTPSPGASQSTASPEPVASGDSA